MSFFKNAWKQIKRFFSRQRTTPTTGGHRNMRDQNYYMNLWDTMEVLPSKKSTVEWYVERCRRGMQRYKSASNYVHSKTGRLIKWEVFALLHSLEASCDFDKQILNGQKWDQRTTWVPRGLGPWESWQDACVTAFEHSRWENVDFANVESLLSVIESFNGWGYKYRGKHSPYLWSFCNHGVGTGKFVSDGNYSPTAISKQCGAAVILKELGYGFKHEAVL